MINIQIRSISIERRLAYTFFILSLIPIIIVGYTTAQIAREAIITKTTKYVQQLIGVVEEQLKSEVKGYETLLDELIINEKIQENFAYYRDNTYAERAIIKQEIDKVVTPKLFYNTNIRDIKMINRDKEVIYQRGYLLNDEAHIDNMLEAIEKIGGKVQCFSQSIYNENYMIIAKQVNSTYTRECVGHILLVLKKEAIDSIYKDIDLGEGSNIYILDGFNKLISSQYRYGEEQVNEENSHMALEKIIKTFSHEQGNYGYYESEDESYLLIREDVSQYNVKCLGTIPNTYLLEDIKGIIKNILLIIVLCFIVFWGISKRISKSITDPLKKLLIYIESAMKDEFRGGYIDNSPDELGVLGRHYVEINNQMQEMIKKIEQDEKERRELEINMLQAQINPHFLFNTLNSLRWIAMMSRAESVSQGILALSDLLRNTIIHKAEYITIESEFDNIKNYVLIQKLRYGESFEISWDIDRNLMGCRVIKFILQPIVENAILHASKDDDSILHIRIALEERQGDIYITIADDGKGFNIIEIEESKDKDIKLSGIGMDNVKDRIKLHFGEGYGVKIKSKINKGTKVVLHIPKIEGD